MSSDHLGEGSRRRFGWGAWVGLVVVGVVVVALIFFLVRDNRSGKRLAAAEDKLVAMGYSLDPTELYRDVDPAVNGYEFGKSAIMARPDTETIGNWYFLTRGETPLVSSSTYDKYKGVLPLDAVDSSALKGQITSTAEPPAMGGAPSHELVKTTLIVPEQFVGLTRVSYDMALLNVEEKGAIVADAVRMPDWLIPRDLSRPSQLTFPEFGQMRLWSKVFVQLGLEHFRVGEIEEGVRDFETAFLLTDKMALEKTSFGTVSQVTGRSYVRLGVMQAVNQMPPEQQLKAIPMIRKTLEGFKSIDLRKSMKREVLYFTKVRHEIGSALKDFYDPWVQYMPINKQLVYTQVLERFLAKVEVIEAAGDDPYAYMRISADTKRSPIEGLQVERELVELFWPDFEPFYLVPIRDAELARLSLIGLSVLEQEAASNAIVQSLSELDGVDITDPMSKVGGDSQFRREGDGFVVWGVGPDGIDSGGIVDENNPSFRKDYVLYVGQDRARFIY